MAIQTLKLGVLPLFLSLVFNPCYAQKLPENTTDITMFPKAEAGFQQVMINMPPQKDENNFSVEFYAGKTLSVDCNQHSLSGTFERVNLEGWGYDYYKFSSKGDIASTMMACADNKSVEKFVKTPSQNERYNSKLPIVLYIPKGYEVRYKIWVASNKEYSAIEHKVQHTKMGVGRRIFSKLNRNAVDTNTYPATQNDMHQYYISMHPKRDDENYKIGFYAGKMMDVDCNQVTLGGAYEDVDTQGLAYSHIQFKNSAIATTLMGCLDQKTTQKFITTQPQLKRYNSKSSILVTVPKDYEVRYRIWSAGTERIAQ